MLKVAQILLLIFLACYQCDARAQSAGCSCKADSIQLFSLNIEEYHFSFTNMSQGLCFNNIIYEIKPRICAIIYNDTKDTIVNLFRERDTHIHWMRDGGRFDTIYPGQAMKLKGLATGGKFIGSMNTSSIYLKYQIKDRTYSNTIRVCGSIYPSDFKNTIIESSNERRSFNPNNNSFTKQNEFIRRDTIIKIQIDSRIYFDTLPFPFPSKYDTLPYREDKIWINGYFQTINGGTLSTLVNRKVYIDGTVLEYYESGQLYSRRTKEDSSSLKPLFASYYQNGNIWTEKFNDRTIEYYNENGKVKSIIKDNIKTTFFLGNGKTASVEYLDKKWGAPTPYLTNFSYKTGCKTKEIYAGANDIRTEVNYSQDTCDCPKSKISNTSEIYYKNCDFTVKKVIMLKYPSVKMGEFDSFSNLITGKEEIGRIIGENRTYFFTKLNSQYLTDFTFRRFTETRKLEFHDSIFVIEFNRYENGKKHGIWLNCDLTTEEIVSKLYTWKPKSYKSTSEFVFEYPWKIYEHGQLIETQFYSIVGDLMTRIAYRGADSVVTNYEYKLLIDSNIVSVDSPYYISSNDTITFYYQTPFETTFVYENLELHQKTSPHLKIEQYSSGPPLHSSGIKSITIPFTVEKGGFRELSLYNGTIEYYDKGANLIKISTVINGKENTANKP